MNILSGILKTIFGRSAGGASGRVGIIAIFAAGWVSGAKLGLPEPVIGMVDAGLGGIGEMISGLADGE